jgi:N-sulfoglucosamine sulfohydrolase
MKAILVALLLSVTLAGGAQAQKPNIVVFLSDDHSLRDSMVYGSKDVKTPAMDGWLRPECCRKAL